MLTAVIVLAITVAMASLMTVTIIDTMSSIIIDVILYKNNLCNDNSLKSLNDSYINIHGNSYRNRCNSMCNDSLNNRFNNSNTNSCN